MRSDREVSQPEDWWSRFFEGLHLEFHRRKWQDEELNQWEASRLASLLGVERGDRVLDIPCGNGRHALHLAQSGFRVTGIDVTEEYVTEASTRATSGGLDIDYLHSDMRDGRWLNEFDAAYCTGGSFGYFDDEGNLAFLQGVHRSLKESGRFLLDAAVVETVLPRHRARDWEHYGDFVALHDRIWHLWSGVVELKLTLISGGREETRSYFQKVYRLREVVALLRQAGFQQITALGSLLGEEYSLESTRLYLLAHA